MIVRLGGGMRSIEGFLLYVTVYNCKQARRTDHQQWTSPNIRLILDAAHDALSQKVNTETTLLDSLLTSLQQTRTFLTDRVLTSAECRLLFVCHCNVFVLRRFRNCGNYYLAPLPNYRGVLAKLSLLTGMPLFN